MRRLILGAVALASVVAVLGALVSQSWHPLLDLDLSVASALRFDGGGSHGVDALQVLTAPGSTGFRLVVLLPLALLYAARRQFRVTGFVLLAAGTVGLLTSLLKILVGRERPTTDDPLVFAHGLSYPSGHSSGAAVLAGVLIVILWPLVSRHWRPFLVAGLTLLALTVAWTRIGLGVHYLSDTVGGLCLGAAVVLASMALFGMHPGGRGWLPEGGRPDRTPESAGLG